MLPATQNHVGSLGAFQPDPEIFYRTVLESLSEGVVPVGADHRIFYANRMATELTGYPTEELVGQIGYQLLLPAGRASLPYCSRPHPVIGTPEGCEVALTRL